MKRRRWLWAALALVALILLLSRVHIGPVRWDRELTARVSTYLAANRQALDLGDFRPTMLDIAGKRVILLGEWHGMATMDELDLAMLRYLHRAAGVRVYAAEFGYAMGCLLNRYLDTGDETALDRVMRETATSMAWTRERRAFYARLREWNQTLPQGERVRLAGLDIEQQHRLALRYLDDLAWQRSKAAPEIREILDKLEWMENGSLNRTKWRYVRDLASSVASHRDAYAALLGDRLFDFEMTAGNLVRTVECYEGGDAKAPAIREHAIYDNFRKLYPRMGGGVWYGRWGADHIDQRRAENVNHFAALLNGENSPVAGKVVSIYPLFSHSEAMGPDYRPGPVDTDATASRPFASAALPDRITLFRLDGVDSPFRQRVPGNLQGDLAQYVVLLRNATPSHPLEP
jgi:hypothetical protein